MSYNFWQGEKIRLRAIEPKDAGTFFKWDTDYDTESDRFCDTIHFPGTCEGMKGRVERMIQSNGQEDAYRWMIEDKEGNAVGTINTHSCDPRFGTFRYGLGISRGEWGKGYAKEAIKIVLRYYFRELRYQKVTVNIYSFNERSVKLHESLGFKHEGRLRQMIYTNGSYYDEIIMGMTREEFDAVDAKTEL